MRRRYNSRGLLEFDVYDSGNDGVVERTRHLTYDDRGRLTQIQTFVGEDEGFVTRRNIYLGNVLVATVSGDADLRKCTRVATYSYDWVDGRILAEHFDEGCDGTVDSWLEYEYESDGTFIGSVRFRGPDLREKIEEYEWHSGRIAEIRIRYPELGPAEVLVGTFEYDSEGRLIRTSTYNGIDDVPASTQWYTYVGPDQLGETAIVSDGVERLRSAWTYDVRGLPVSMNGVSHGIRTHISWVNECTPETTLSSHGLSLQ